MGTIYLLGCCLIFYAGHVHGGQVNVAAFKKTAQSTSTHSGASYRAVDTCYNPVYAAEGCGCTHTSSQTDAWWSVNLGIISTVHFVKILNRGDCCPERLTPMNIWVATETNDPSASDRQLCTYRTDAIPNGNNGLETIYCDQPLTGLYLIIDLPGNNRIITICEIEVWVDEHSHWGPIFNYATSKPIQMNNVDDAAISATVVDNDHATCPDTLDAGDQSGKISVDMGHDVRVSKVRVYQSSSCEYYCSTRLDIRGWGNDDPAAERVEFINVNETDQTDGLRSRGWTLITIDECGCTIKDRRQIDHFSGDQQSGCMESDTGFTPYIENLEDGDIIIGVSKDEVQQGLDACYRIGLEYLNLPTDYGYRYPYVFIAKKGFPDFSTSVIVANGQGPALISEFWIGASPLHVFTAGTTSSPLANSLSQTCGSHDGLVGRGEVAVLECDSDNLPMGRYFQLNFPSNGVHICEVEIYLGTLFEYCPETSDRCFYVPSRKYSTVEEAAWECTTLYANARAAVTDTDAISQFVSARDNAGLDFEVLPGITYHTGAFHYYATNDPVGGNTNGLTGDFLYINQAGSYTGANNGDGPFYPLCDVPKPIFSGQELVVMRVSAYSTSLDSSIYALWTGADSVPTVNEDVPAGLTTLDVTEDVIYKSPLIDCAWDFVKEVRVSFYKRDVEVAFLNFINSDSTTKETFFSSTQLTGSTWTDMYEDPRTVSLSGPTISGLSRRFLFERTSDGCAGEGSETAWFAVLDTDHTACNEWDTVSAFPAFIYSDSVINEAETDTDLNSADLMRVTVRLESSAFSGSCIMLCDGQADGQYQSCFGCNVFVTCTSEVATYIVCRAGYVWQSTGVGSGECVETSTSCTDRAATPECAPDGCVTNPCANGGTCSNAAAGGWQCACVSGWESFDCSIEVDECASSPCQFGNCVDDFNSYACNCEAGYEGTHCETNIDECDPNPCENGGVCTDGIASYTCQCADGFIGESCGTNFDECGSSPCQHGGECVDDVNMYSCTCAPGYVGDHCETDFDDCAASPCDNGGACTDEVNGFSCACTPGYEGDTCDVNIDECASDPCQNGGDCTDGVNEYTCTCVDGYVGDYCETNFDECASSPCQHGDCVDDLNSYACDCEDGYEGTHCETNIDECDPNPCDNGGACTDGIAAFTCQCADGFTGETCGTNVDECGSSPCQHGGECVDDVNMYSCTCAPGYVGDHCETDFDDCAASPCDNGGACTDEVNGFSCACTPGYEGDTCDVNIDECASDPCQNGGDCTDGVNEYTCTCVDGYVGDYCETNFDECASSPCQHGDCVDALNSYACDCEDGYEGTHCETNIDECDPNPCDNGGACTDGIAAFTCQCADGFTGETCGTNVDECGSSPCQHGGECVDDVNMYSCTCAPGYVGDHCETDFDDCAANPCDNGGACTDDVNGFSCACIPGYEGDTCDVNINECASNPCQNGGDCTDGVNGYTCTCMDGYVGDYCETDFDECASNPCQYNATCTDNVNGFTCLCVDGFSGDLCENGTCEEYPDFCENDGVCSNIIEEEGEEVFASAECDCTDTEFRGFNCSEPVETGRQRSNGGNNDDDHTTTYAAVFGTVGGVAALAGGAGAIYAVRKKMKKDQVEEIKEGELDQSTDNMPEVA